MTDVLVTIATQDFLPLAGVMIQSHKKHNSNAHCRIILVDADAQKDSYSSGEYTTTPVSELLDKKVLRELKERYTPSEFCFALKPLALKAVLDEGFERAIYVDSDIYFCGRLDGMLDCLAEHPILLTPHRLRPHPDTEDELVLLRAGQFNAGFVAVNGSPRAIEFLDWWWSKTRFHAYNKPFQGMCGDQRWLDVVPVLFPEVYIARAAGLNVAHWNLDERPIVKRADQWLVGNEPLVFFHFSGFAADNDRRLSVHSETALQGALQDLATEYREKVVNSGFQRPPPEGWWPRIKSRIWSKS